MNKPRQSKTEWWTHVPESEKAFIRVLIGMIHEVKAHGRPEVAHAAGVWESSLVCFIKTRLRHRRTYRVPAKRGR
jgi:hypothetical protein